MSLSLPLSASAVGMKSISMIGRIPAETMAVRYLSKFVQLYEPGALVDAHGVAQDAVAAHALEAGLAVTDLVVRLQIRPERQAAVPVPTAAAQNGGLPAVCFDASTVIV